MKENQILNYAKVEQFYNKNQFIIKTNNSIIFQSYNSIICILTDGEKNPVFGNDWDYSKTTIKHLYLFLYYYLKSYNCDYELKMKIMGILANSKNKKADLQKLINNGEIILDENI